MLVVACEESKTEIANPDGLSSPDTADVVGDTSLVPNDSDSLNNKSEVSNDDVFAAIVNFRDRLNQIGKTNTAEGGRISKISDNIFSRDLLVENNVNVGIDEEWLDMSIQVLNFAEYFAKSTDKRREEILYRDLLDNTDGISWPIYDDDSNWGWPLYEETKIVLSYLDGELFIRVIDHSWIQTFVFNYQEDNTLPETKVNENTLVRVFRLIEYTDNSPNLYIEDFLEKTGLTLWWSSGEYYMTSTVLSADGGYYTISSDHSGLRWLTFANYIIDGVPANVNLEYPNTIKVTYDFKYVDGFDSFSDNDEIFLNNVPITSSLEMRVRRAYSGAETFILTGTKTISEDSVTLSLDEFNIHSDITKKTVLENIKLLMNSTGINGITYDYTKDLDSILEDISQFLYLEY